MAVAQAVTDLWTSDPEMAEHLQRVPGGGCWVVYFVAGMASRLVSYLLFFVVDVLIMNTPLFGVYQDIGSNGLYDFSRLIQLLGISKWQDGKASKLPLQRCGCVQQGMHGTATLLCPLLSEGSVERAAVRLVMYPIQSTIYDI